MNILPAKTDFCHMAEKYSVIPVYTVLDTDMETPVSLYYKLVGEETGFLLESAESNKAFGRYSFLGVRPFAKLTARKNQTVVAMRKDILTFDGPPLAALDQFMRRFSCPVLPGMPFTGGGVGYFSYDSVATWERVRGKTIPEDMLLAELLFCQTVIIMDHLTHSTTLIYLALAEEGKDSGRQYEEAASYLKNIAQKIRQPMSQFQHAPAEKATAVTSGFGTALDREKYVGMVKKAKEYIAAGDIFQIVLSQRFQTCVNGVSPFSLYRKLRRVNPSPYMFYLNFGQRQLVGASPEMLVKIDGSRVFTCPIAGTRPRGKDNAADEQFAADLLADEKERAEHAMLVDLGRNDLGRISLPGTVEVTRYMEVEKFSHVMHLVSKVSGAIHPKFRAVDALAACFPAGTVSGAPKVRAMEIIEELETVSRGIYSGAVGYLDFGGNMDTCITIRTMVVEGSNVTVQAGAGIVADSVPEKEFQEVIHKATALFKVIEGA